MLSQTLEYEEKFEEKELTTQEKILTDPLPEFLPQWAAKVLDGVEVNLQYGDSSRCLVGETHGMSRNYQKR